MVTLNDDAPAKPHTAGIASLFTTLVGLLGVMSANPPKNKIEWATFGLAAAGAVLQAVTKPVTAGDTDLVPKK